MIDKIGQLVRDITVHKVNWQKFKQAGVYKDAKRLYMHGLASRDLLEYLWSTSQTAFLIDLMRAALLLSDW